MLATSTAKSQFSTAKLLKQGYRQIMLSKLYHKQTLRVDCMLHEYNIGLKTLLQQGISQLVFYGY